MTGPNTGTIVEWEGSNEAKPLHFHPNASKVEYDPDDPMTSSIFRISYNEFRVMRAQAIREVYRHRHILVYDCDIEEPYSWTRECMNTICPLKQTVEVQGKFAIGIHGGNTEGQSQICRFVT